MTVEELKKSSPVLVNRDVWERIRKENEKTSNEEGSNKVNFTVIHLYYKTINKVEYSLLNDSAKACCYQISDELKEFDGYLIFVGDSENIDDYWKKYIGSLKKNDLLIELEVSEKIFENDYFERYTKQIKKLDIIYVVNWKKLIGISKPLGIPVIDTLKGLSEDILGLEDEDRTIIDSKAEELKSIYLDPLVYKVNFKLINQKVPSNLQDIVFYGCKNHDMNELKHYSYRYSYKDYSYKDGNTEKIHKIHISVIVDKLSDNICAIRFQSETLNDKDHYLYFNHELFKYLGNKKVIKKIYDNSEYWTEKIKSDLITN